MSELERLHRINNLLQARGTVSRDTFLQELEVSLATFKRDLETLRSSYNAPIVYDTEAEGYRLDKQGPGPRFELPGLWFNQSEAYALLMMEHLLASLDQGGFLGNHIAPLRTRLAAILDGGKAGPVDLRSRIRLVAFAPRNLPLAHFETIGLATQQRKRLRITYYARSTDSTSQREISPQRLVHYRGNWYLDAWCHLRHDLRKFAIDCVREAEPLDAAADELPHEQLEAHLATSYGIVHGGGDVRWAKLRFSADRAR